MKRIFAPRKFASLRGVNREKWLEFRRAGIGGSDAGAILGLNPYVSAFQIYCDKLGLLPECEDNEAMRQGRDFEDYVARRFMEETGFKVRRSGYMWQHAEHDWALANVDRLLVGQPAGLECKTTSVLSRTQYDKGDIPAQYYAQCMHYMAVTGLPVWYLAVLVLNKALYVFKVERDEDEVQNLLTAEKDFWENHVLAQSPPEPDGSERAGKVISQLHPVATAEAPVPLFDDAPSIERYLRLDTEIKEKSKERDQIKQHLQLELGDSSEGIANGYTVRWPSHTTTRIDNKRLKAERPEIYTEYLKESLARRFEIKEDKAS